MGDHARRMGEASHHGGGDHRATYVQRPDVASEDGADVARPSRSEKST